MYKEMDGGGWWAARGGLYLPIELLKVVLSEGVLVIGLIKPREPKRHLSDTCTWVNIRQICTFHLVPSVGLVV